jgi:hypothetical protein
VGFNAAERSACCPPHHHHHPPEVAVDEEQVLASLLEDLQRNVADNSLD